MRAPVHLAAVTLLVAGLLAAGAGGASAHAQLVSVWPADGARLTTSPDAVVVTFSEPVSLAAEGLQVIDSVGAVVEGAAVEVDGPVVRAALPPLPDGWYVVTWAILSEDGHIVRAASVFGVGEADATARPSTSLERPIELAIGLTRAITDLGLLVAAGAWAAWWWLRARTVRVRRLALAASVASLAGTAAWLGAGWLAGGEAWLGTAAALAAVARVILLATAVVAARTRPVVAATATLVALVTLVGGGHTAGAPLAMLLVVAHLLAATTWLGSAPAVLLVLTDRGLDEASALGVVRRFSALAPLSLLVIGLAGIAAGIVLTDGLAGGLTAPYVLLLAAKALVVGVAAIVGAGARRQLRGTPTRGTLRRVFALDAALLVVVVTASAALTLTAPREGHAGHVEHAAGTRCAVEAGPHSLSLVLSPARPGLNDMRIDGVPPAALEVGVQMTHAATLGAPILLPAAHDGTSWTASAILPLEGPWNATVAIRLDRFTEVRGDCTLTL